MKVEIRDSEKDMQDMELSSPLCLLHVRIAC